MAINQTDNIVSVEPSPNQPQIQTQSNGSVENNHSNTSLCNSPLTTTNHNHKHNHNQNGLSKVQEKKDAPERIKRCHSSPNPTTTSSEDCTDADSTPAIIISQDENDDNVHRNHKNNNNNNSSSGNSSDDGDCDEPSLVFPHHNNKNGIDFDSDKNVGASSSSSSFSSASSSSLSSSSSQSRDSLSSCSSPSPHKILTIEEEPTENENETELETEPEQDSDVDDDDVDTINMRKDRNSPIRIIVQDDDDNDNENYNDNTGKKELGNPQKSVQNKKQNSFKNKKEEKDDNEKSGQTNLGYETNSTSNLNVNEQICENGKDNPQNNKEQHSKVENRLSASLNNTLSTIFLSTGGSLRKGRGSKRAEFVTENARRKNLKSLRFRLLKEADGSDRIREETFLRLFKNTELLGKLFSLFDHNQQQKLKQDEWIEFLKARLNREEKQVDFVEVVESVTYAICGDSDVNFEHFCAIFRTINVLNKFFRLIDKDQDGTVKAEEVMDFISQLSSSKPSSRLTKENIKWLEKLFRQTVGDGNEIRKADFNKIIQTKNQFFTERVFEIFDRDSSGSISLQEFLDCMHQFTGSNPDDKIHFLFKVYDVDGDGLIQEAELEQVMTACMEENGMKFSDEQIHELTMALFEDADVEKRGALTYEALKAQLEKHGGLLENLSISIDCWLVPPKPRSEKKTLIAKLRSWKPHQLSPRYFRNNYVYLIWLTAFLITNAALFFYRIFCWRWRDGHFDEDSTDFLVVARAAGQCLNFNCTFIVVVMLRQSLTFLRARGASSYLPIDQHIYFHKMTGWFIFLFSLIHTVMHLVNISEGIMANPVHQNTSYMSILFDPTVTELGLIKGYGFNTGVILMIILVTMVVCSLPFVRRGGCFEVFYWTHLLYFAFWVLLIIHAPNYWKWFLVPGVIFVIEQTLRYYHWRVGRGRTYISSGILLPSKVTHLAIRRPPNFEFRPGDYVFVRIPKIAKYEWHPFTISSAPEQDDVISLHIRAAGEWTTRLYNYFEQEQSKLLASNGEELCLRPRIPTFSTGRPGNKKVCMSPNLSTKMLGPELDVREVNGRKVAFEENRNRLKSVGDSVTTVGPSSSLSGSPSPSVQDFSSSSIETMSESEAIVKEKKIPIRLHKPKLESTKSLPNVHERLIERERKLYLRQSPQVQRSLSVQSCEDDAAKDGTNTPGQNRSNPKLLEKGRDQSIVDSLRYMRNKPTIIALKTPTFDGKPSSESADLNNPVNMNNCAEKLAEEGISPLGGGEKEEIAEKSPVKRQWSSFQVTGRTFASDEEDTACVGRPLEIYVDGPYGAPSSHIFRAQHAVLIATGIGVTPFASILQSIMLKYWASRTTCPNCTFTWCADMPQSVFNLKKVDFLWINREQRSFEWFVHLLSQLEIEQAEQGGAMERFLDMHMYITSALQRTDMKAVGLQLALDLLHEKEKRDLITGLKTRTNAGRPNWTKLFQQLQDQNKGKITVFYCGPPTLARTLKIKCDEFNFNFRKELF